MLKRKKKGIIIDIFNLLLSLLLSLALASILPIGNTTDRYTSRIVYFCDKCLIPRFWLLEPHQ